MPAEVNAIVDKVYKLQRLGQSENENEAAAARAAANRLIERHGLDRAEVEDRSGPAVEAVVADVDAPVLSGSNVPVWKKLLLVRVCRRYSCRVVVTGLNASDASYVVVGRSSAISGAKAEFAQLVSDIERMAMVACRGKGSSWRHSWHLGVVDAIGVEFEDEGVRSTRGAGQGTGMGRSATEAADEYVSGHLTERTTTVKRPTRLDSGAYCAGKLAWVGARVHAPGVK